MNVTSNWTGLGFKALFFDNFIGEEEPSDTVPDMPLKDLSHPEKFQLWLSSYTVNGFFHSLTEVLDLKVWLRANETDGKITCDTLKVLLPGIVEYYGAN